MALHKFRYLSISSTDTRWRCKNFINTSKMFYVTKKVKYFLCVQIVLDRNFLQKCIWKKMHNFEHNLTKISFSNVKKENNYYELPKPRPPPGSNLATCCLNARRTALSSCAHEVAAPILVCAIEISPTVSDELPSFS